MEKENLFKWKHYHPELILLTVRWYLRYNLSFRDLVEMMEERGLSLVHTTIMRWVHQYNPELDKRIRRHLKSTNDSWRVDETYIKVKGQWMYLYRAVDSEGNTIDFYLSTSRDKKAAKRFFKKALAFSYVSKPRVITVDKNPAYPVAIQELKEEKHMLEGVLLQSFKCPQKYRMKIQFFRINIIKYTRTCIVYSLFSVIFQLCNRTYNDLTVLNNRIRNAINHSSVDYNSIDQKLTFKDGEIITEKYLIEFAEENYVILYLQLYCLFIVCSLATRFPKEDNA